MLRKKARLSLASAECCVDVTLDALVEELSKGGRVELRGLGVFTVKDVAEKTHCLAGKPQTVEPHGKILFKPSAGLKKAVWLRVTTTE
jgi:nucleoid DNA-binding protein